MNLIILPMANDEFLSAEEWYELQSHGLGKRFKALVKQALSSIIRNPQRYSSNSLGYRRAFVKVFPYKVYYRIDNQDIVVVAFAHNHRKPDFWFGR